MLKDHLIDIYRSVVDDIKRGYYLYEGERIYFLGTDIIREETKVYNDLGRVSGYPKYNSTRIYVENIDTFSKAISLGPGCAVLNMASPSNPGGGVHKGSRSQEEELCRRSNLLYSLYSFSERGKVFGFTTCNEGYPIGRYSGIYSPGISIYRLPQTYRTIENPIWCNVISVPGIVMPRINKETGELQEKDAAILRGKIRTILRIAILNGNSKLVLGALGCGAFRNPPHHVALLFKSVLEEPEFRNSFEEICFAILEDENSIRNGKEGNLLPFSTVFN